MDRIAQRVFGSAVVVTLAAATLAGCNTRYGSNLQRSSDPVVLTGSQVPGLEGADPQHVVAFSHNGSTWHQIPVQVDERDLVSPGEIQHLPTSSYPKLYGTATPYEILVYTPPPTTTAGYTTWSTYTPPDSDPSLDADDEISFLANDAGRTTDAAAPPGVDAASRTPLYLTDPIDGHTGTVYLFTSPPLTGGSAGTTGVDYTFSLDSGDYRDTYHIGPSALAPNDANSPNPEHSTVTTPFYSLGFSDRWLNDALTIHHNGSSGADLLDRSKYFAVTGGCSRTENTFDAIIGYTGEFVVNISGPVRAIRSGMGANSFTYTVLTDVFYPNRQDTTIELRGHAGMPGFGQADDLATDLEGMTYSDPSNTRVPVDGVADSVTPITSTTDDALPPSWQVVSGPAGTMITTRSLTTDLDLDVATTYRDDRATKVCTGDGSTWGQAGLDVMSPVNSVPNTDPTLSADPGHLTSQRTRYYSGPDFSLDDVPALDARAHTPIVVTAG